MYCRVIAIVACAVLCLGGGRVHAQGREPGKGFTLPFPVPEKVQTLITMANNVVFRVSPLDHISPPVCLHELKGGVPTIELAIASALDHSKTPMILVTSKNDKNSLPAMENFYDAVRVLCGEVDPELHADDGQLLQKTTNAQTLGDDDNDDDDDDTDEQSANNEPESASALRRRAIKAAPSYFFAHVSFDGEPDITWRWWIWKVPVIIFATVPTSIEQHLYDLRFWKIGFKVPSKDDFIDAIPDRYWMNLPVWDSYIAPGMPWESFTTLLSGGFGQVYRVLDPIPNWLLTIIGSMFGSMLISMLHSKPAAGAARPAGGSRS